MWRLIKDPTDKSYCLENFEKNLIVHFNYKVHELDAIAFWSYSAYELIKSYNDKLFELATASNKNMTLEDYYDESKGSGWIILLEGEDPNTFIDTNPELFL